MSTIIRGSYVGEKRCTAIHQDSGAELITDAPKDNAGLGRNFSPTDLVGTALGTCMLTTMAIASERDGISLEGALFSVEKEMSDGSPRRIASLTLEIVMPNSLRPEQRAKLERIAMKCPVHHSLHPDVKLNISFK